MAEAYAMKDTQHERLLMDMIERLEDDKHRLLNELYPNDIDITLDDGAYMPEKAHATDAGFDLRAISGAHLWPGRSALIHTGVHVAIPEGYYGRVAPRSGLAVKNGLDVLAGVVDCGYTNEIGVVLINLGSQPYDVSPGDKIAQLVVERIFTGKLRRVGSLDQTERGNNGYGSTGM
ncbi:dUTP pyrophosphatase [Kushneria sinocarnis]|uniref:dUTP diphosphatase n=1 Tax=Kushneria sinocarnis TaxID=595502 RepID=A0A420WUJ3_9GAMM|nr:dUTP diphosphatase [Kushneria sinocarnis]RKQ97104.1 dUTP pyrophosphatase [Kushneria sinocarnis]